jgi:hypothetical protein
MITGLFVIQTRPSQASYSGLEMLRGMPEDHIPAGFPLKWSLWLSTNKRELSISLSGAFK